MPQSVLKDRRFLLCCLCIACVTFLAFAPALKNGFTNWDDDRFVTANPDVHGFSAHNLSKIFTSAYVNHYAPLTMLSFMGEYSLFRLDPAAYHLTNVLLHIINALLVFALIYGLSGSYFTGLLTALLFAVHPLQVESVAWIAERKGVLSAAFYFAALIAYLRFMKNGKRTTYAAVMIFFILSLLSKSMAISLPFVLLLIDYLTGRKIDKKTLIEKTPLFILSIIFTVIAIMSKQDAMGQGPHYSPVQNILAPAFEICFYLVKSIVPFNLCALYDTGEGNALTLIMAVSAAAVCGIAVAVYYSRRYSRIAVFCALYFIVTLAPVLQIVSSGGWTKVADRYTYIPLIGVYFLFASMFSYLLKNTFKKLAFARMALFTGCLAIVAFLVYATSCQCLVWRDGFSLWDNAVKTSPSALAYSNRGYALYLRHDYARALDDYNRAIEINSTYAPIFNKRGNVLNAVGDLEHAIEDYTQAIAIDPRYAQAFNNRGVVYKIKGDFGRAAEDFLEAVRLDPRYAQAFGNLGGVYCYRGELDRAIDAYNQAVRLDPEFAEGYFGRGLAFCIQGEFSRGVEDYNRAIGLNPNYTEAYNNRGVAQKDMGDLTSAVESFNHALALNSRYAQAYYGRGLAFMAQGIYDRAQDDLKTACVLGLSAACKN
jgi:tetratricopeptide (TPR) repeat protein